MQLIAALFGIAVAIAAVYGLLVGSQPVKIVCLFAIIGAPSMVPVMWIRDVLRNKDGNRARRIMKLSVSMAAIVCMLLGLGYGMYRIVD